jgi:glyoxylate carboligase
VDDDLGRFGARASGTSFEITVTLTQLDVVVAEDFGVESGRAAAFSVGANVAADFRRHGFSLEAVQNWKRWAEDKRTSNGNDNGQNAGISPLRRAKSRAAPVEMTVVAGRDDSGCWLRWQMVAG